MGKANALSRMTGLEMGEKDNKNVTLLKPELFISSLMIENPKDEVLNLIRKQKTNINRYVQLHLKAKDKDWERTNDKLILFQNQIYVPRDRNLQGHVIGMHHNT